MPAQATRTVKLLKRARQRKQDRRNTQSTTYRHPFQANIQPSKDILVTLFKDCSYGVSLAVASIGGPEKLIPKSEQNALMIYKPQKFTATVVSRLRLW
jgi:hypothetical protein